MVFPIAAERLIPHRLPMRLIDTLEAFDGETATVRVRSFRDNPLLEDDGTLTTVALLELLAQSYAAIQGYLDRAAGNPVRHGYLVGSRRFAFFHAAKPADELRVELHTVGSFNGFALVEGQIRRGNLLLAEGSIKLYALPPENAPT